MDSKHCCKCGQSKSVKEFSLKRGLPNAQCKACKYSQDKVYRESAVDKIAKRNTTYWQSIKGTEKQVELNRKKCSTYRKTHPEVARFHTAKYRAKKLQATPTWANLDVIYEFYFNCPEGHHVDHIIPLQGESVSGFHVIENLQYLPAQENLSKSNKFLYQS